MGNSIRMELMWSWLLLPISVKRAGCKPCNIRPVLSIDKYHISQKCDNNMKIILNTCGHLVKL